MSLPAARFALTQSFSALNRNPFFAAQRCLASATAHSHGRAMNDPQFPGTAVARLQSIHARVSSLLGGTDAQHQAREAAALNNLPWPEARQKLLWAGGLHDFPDARAVPPGSGYTGHAFNDDNHCDLTPMSGGEK